MSKRGQIYIGLIISMAVLAILSQAIVALVFSSYDLLNFTSSRTSAKYIAQEKMELIRNMSYDQVGTQGGIPSGNIPQLENIQVNGLNYEVRTSVIFIDDPFDGNVPQDLLPTDYKRVRVEVNWGGLGQTGKNPVVLVSDVSPRNIEESEGGGTLSIFVIDALGNPLPSATAHIVANTNPPVDLTLNTGATGYIILPGAPACSSCYQITVTKQDFSTERTYATSEISTPAKPHQSIILNQLTQVSFAIDRTSSLDLATVSDYNTNFTPLPTQALRVRGDKIIGTDSNDDPVYKFDQVITTNSSGQFSLSNLEWGTYYITPNTTSQDIAGSNPFLPLVIDPQTENNLQLVLKPHTAHTLLASFVDSGDIPIASVTAQLKNDLGIPVATASSGLSTNPDWGQVFFSSLTSSNYTLEATASGFTNLNYPATVFGQTQVKIIMTQ